MNADTRTAVIAMARTHSYSLVAEKFGLTKNQVAGIIWRKKNPKSSLIYVTTRGKRCGGRNGHGRGGATRFSHKITKPFGPQRHR